MRRTNGDGSLSYFVLPLQYNYRGDFDNDSPEDWPWRDYRSDLWYDFWQRAHRSKCAVTFNDDPTFNHESFDNNCAGCHMTGYRLEGSDADGWSAQRDRRFGRCVRLRWRRSSRADQHGLRVLSRPGLRALGAQPTGQLHRFPRLADAGAASRALRKLSLTSTRHRCRRDRPAALGREPNAACGNPSGRFRPESHQPGEWSARGVLRCR